jgi:tetratricopeptide (TPR) repeat protein
VIARDGIEAGRRFHKRIAANGFVGYNATAFGYYANAEELRDLGHHVEALALVELGAEQHPNDGNLYVALGDTYRQMQNVEHAERNYRRALALCDSHPEINEGVREHATQGLEQLDTAPVAAR